VGEPPDDAEQERERPLWQLSGDDRRLLLITFVGGLAANVGLVLIVGLGLAVAHLIHRYQHAIGSFVFGTAVQFGATLLLLLYRLLRPRRIDPLQELPSEREVAERLGLVYDEVDEETARMLRSERMEREQYARLIARRAQYPRRIALAVMVPVSVILILALVGYAAGIK